MVGVAGVGTSAAAHRPLSDPLVSTQNRPQNVSPRGLLEEQQYASPDDSCSKIDEEADPPVCVLDVV